MVVGEHGLIGVIAVKHVQKGSRRDKDFVTILPLLMVVLSAQVNKSTGRPAKLWTVKVGCSN